MIKARYIAYKLLGLKNYLRLVSRIYIKLIERGHMKKSYPELHFLKKMINKGDTCIDIGANLGYYSYFLSKYTGMDGKVYAIEPVELFGKIWKKNVSCSKINNLVLLPYALGAEEKSIEMGMPKVVDTVHHGMTKIISDSKNECEKVFKAEMRIPDKLFHEIEKIDFIKIDVEGYESVVLENMKQTLEKHSPLIQGEMGGIENRKACIKILRSLNFNPYILKDGRLVEVEEKDVYLVTEDIYFKKK